MLAVVFPLRLVLVGLRLLQLCLRLHQLAGARTRVISRSTWALASCACARDSVGACLVARGDVVARIDLQHQVACVDDGVVVDVEFA